MAILGIDEVGRGPWAGPLVIGAVILPEEKPAWVDELTDSKKLSAKKREALNELILKEATTGLGWVSSKELDEIGLAKALKLATRRAVEEVRAKNVPFSEIIIDGTINFLAGTSLERYVTILPKADFLVKEVSAASIIAKVARDHYMYELGQKYPGYGFEKHVGYGTAAHQKALKELGPCEEHRMSFRPVKENVVKNTTKIGKKAEDIVADYLRSQGHEIIVQNYKTKAYEIDIISTFKNDIYFTEVKYRKTATHGEPLEAITAKKQEQMHFAAEAFLHTHPQLKNKNPHLAAAGVAGTDYGLTEWLVI